MVKSNQLQIYILIIHDALTAYIFSSVWCIKFSVFCYDINDQKLYLLN